MENMRFYDIPSEKDGNLMIPEISFLSKIAPVREVKLLIIADIYILLLPLLLRLLEFVSSPVFI